jgi:hypothetical protein
MDKNEKWNGSEREFFPLFSMLYAMPECLVWSAQKLDQTATTPQLHEGHHRANYLFLRDLHVILVW